MKKIRLILFTLILIPVKVPCQNHLYISSGSTITANSNITLSDANLNNNGIYNGAIQMTGTFGGDVFIDNNGIVNFTTLDIDGTNTVNLETGAINISSAINLASDEAQLVMSSANIILGSSAQINNESNDRTLSGSDGTYIYTTRDHIAGVNNDFGFIGVETRNGSTDMGSTEIFRHYGTFEINGNPTVTRYYEINSAVNSELDIDARFYLNDIDLNGLERSHLAAFRSTDNGVTFTNEGGTPEGFYHSVLNIASFSIWTFADSSVLNLDNTDDKDYEIKVFPNPTSGLVHVKNMRNINVTSVELINLHGQKIQIELLDENTFNVSNLSGGVYLLNIYTEIGTTTKKLIIKKR